MNDVKKILIAAISVVLVVAIVAGVSIGVLAGTVNGMKDQIAELNQTVETLQSENDAMKAEIAEATANNEKLVTAEDFEAKLAAAIGEQNQTMQALVSTAVKNQIEELGVEGLTEAQVKEIINAAVANCITEDEVNELIANSDTGLTEAEVKKLITNANAGFLTYAQIVNLIDDNIYDLRNYLESVIAGVQDGLTTMLVLSAEDAVGGVYTIDNEAVSNLASGINSIVTLSDDDWSEISIVIDEDLSKRFEFYLYADIDELVVNTYYASIRISANVNTLIVKTTDAFIGVNSAGSVGTLIAEDCGNEDADRNASVSNSGEIGEFVDNADGYTVTIVGSAPETWTEVDGNIEYAFSDYGETVTISGEGAVEKSFEGNETIETVIVEEGITAIGTKVFKKCPNLVSVTLPEGLKTIEDSAFDQSTNIAEVNFPSTLETIGASAFRKIALKGTLTLSATVKTLGEGAFRDMPNIETVIIEGDTTIANFAFRECASLKTVILSGEPTFTGTSMVFCISQSGNPTDTKIAVWVRNDDIKSAVETANGSCIAQLTISTIVTAEDSETLAGALEAGTTYIELGEGEFTLPSLSGKQGMTLIGAADGSTVIGGENVGTGFGSQFGKDTTIKNITFSGSTNGVRYSYAQGGTSVFENCTFAGGSLYGFHIDSSNGATFVFNNCTFVGFNAFAGDLESVTFNNCTFKSNGSYGHTNIWSTGHFNGCTFEEGATYGVRGDGVIYINGVQQ